MMSQAMQTITVLGSTGSIGISTLDVVSRHPRQFKIFALTANTNVNVLFEQCLAHHPRFAVMLDEQSAQQLQARLSQAGEQVSVLSGIDSLESVAAAPEVDTVMAAIVGIAGLRPTLAAAGAGKKLLLANKEALVTAGGFFMDTVRISGARLLPIDSEHNAIFQSLPHDYNGNLERAGVRRILLTASGGPFRTTPASALVSVTPEQACAHPNWVMGRKISVDSATMMNKGLEVIEAHWLFGAAADHIQVVLHPQSVVHSLVEYIDGSVIAQLGNPDMRTPIAHALGFPARINAGVNFLDLAAIGSLHFERPDLKRFPCLQLAFDALKAGGSAPTVVNAANEIAVSRFLARDIGFMDIPMLIENVLEATEFRTLNNLNDVIEIDADARERAETWLAHRKISLLAGTQMSLPES